MTLQVYPNHSRVLEIAEERKVKAKQNHNSNLNHFPLPLNRKKQYEDANNYYHNENYRGNTRGCRPYRGQYSSRKPYRGSKQREGGQQKIIEANTKATVDNFTPLMVAITIITMAIIEVEVAVAMMVTFIDHAVVEEAIAEAITIINTINITCIMMDLSLNNMVHHVLFVEVSIILLNIALRENMTSIILWRK